MRQLATAKLVSSTKGPNGGFFLDTKNRKKSVWDIIKSIDGIDKFNQCFLGLSKCDDNNPCPVHATVSPFKQKLLRDFRDKTIENLVEDIKRKGTVISLKDFDSLDS